MSKEGIEMVSFESLKVLGIMQKYAKVAPELRLLKIAGRLTGLSGKVFWALGVSRE